MYHINVILIFFIAFLVKIRVLAQKSLSILTRKSLAERMYLLWFPQKYKCVLLESTKAFMV